MARQAINTGTAADDGSGDSLRGAMQKVEANFTELYGKLDDAWTTYTPTMTFTSGAPTYTALGSYKRIGSKTYLVRVSVNITALGGASGVISFSAPNGSSAVNITPASGVDVSLGANVQYAGINGTSIQIVPTGGIAAHRYDVSVFYEAA